MRFFHTPPALDAPLGEGPRLNIAIRFGTERKKESHTNLIQKQLRWNQADLVSYYYHSGSLLNPLLAKLDDFLIRYDKDEVTVNDIAVIVEKAYHDITDALASCAKQFVPERKKSFYKYSGGMKIWIFLSKHLLIQIDYRLHLANRVTALFLIKDKKHDYNIAIVSDRVKELTTNFTKTSFMTLYLEKTALFFWKCWRSNFTSNNKCLKVEGNEHLYSPQVVAKS